MNQLDLFGLLFDLDNLNEQQKVSNGFTLTLSKNNEDFCVLVNGHQNSCTINKFNFTFKLDNSNILDLKYKEGCLIMADTLINLKSTEVISREGKIYFVANGPNDINITGLADACDSNHPLCPIAGFVEVDKLKYKQLIIFPNFQLGDYQITVLSDPPHNHILEWKDDYNNNPDQGVSSIQQSFAFYSAWFPMDQQQGTIKFQPISSKGIFLSPDILDSTCHINEIDNNFLFQHIVLDAYVLANFIVDNNRDNWIIDKWELLPESKEKGMTIATPALKDENGFPLLIRTRERLPLIVRSGNVYPDQNRKLNNAIVISSNITHEYSCQLVSFIPDPQIVLSDQPPQLNEDRLIQDPPWITCSIDDKPPREIIGWSRNGVIRLLEREQELSCSLNLNSVLINSDKLPSYVLASIEFSANSTKLLVDLPEKECQSISPDTGNLQRLEGIGKLGMNISLPLCDTAWAFADLSGHSQNYLNESEQSLASKISKVLFDLNSKLVDAFVPPKDSKYIHIEGHRGQLPQQVFEQLLSVPPITTKVNDGSERNWLALAPSETTLKMPLTEVTTDPPGSVFLFGGANFSDEDFDLATKLLKGEANFNEQELNSNKVFFPIKLPQGESELLSKVKEQWINNEKLSNIRQKYGEFLLPEVLQRINENESDSELLLQQLKESGINLSTLDDLLTKPPDYLVLSKSCPAANSKGSEQSVGLYKLNFDFCKLSDNKNWTMDFKSQDISFIVKLGGDRSLAAILAELNTTYANASNNHNPLALAGGLLVFVQQLATDLLKPSWRGVLVINPQITLDPELEQLCGLKSIKGTYAAISGHANQYSPIDVWGRIDQQTDPENANGERGNEGSWALIKFEATIKNTIILAAEIQFRLQINELLGKKCKYPPVDLIGSLKAADSKEPRDFSFAASFKSPLIYDIKESFLDSILLHSVKIGKYKGQAALALDADLKLRCAESVIQDLPKDPLKLTNFYILLPKQDKDDKRKLGQWVDLAFDLGGIRVSLPDKDGSKLRILGFEIKPVGIGVLKGNQSTISKILDVKTIELKKPIFNNNNNTIYSYPYLDTLVQFGEDLDVKGENQLSFTLRSGTPIPSNGCQPGVGLASLQGKNVKLSLFGLLTVSAEKVSAKSTSLIDPDNQNADKVPAAVVEVINFNLGILSWNMFENGGERKLIFAQSADGLSKGVLGWYATADRNSSKFFQLHWLLLARNFDPGKKVKNALLTPNKPLINGLHLEDVNILNAKLDNDNSWFFGFAFSLSSLFTDCAFVLHEKSYYGIRLGGEVAKLLTGEEVIALAYIPGEKPELSRFRTEFRCPALDMIGDLRSGLMALEWAPNWDFVLDFGFPWRVPAGYEWSRAFSMPVGVYEAQFGFFIERRTTLTQNKTELTLSAGAGFYLGYKYEAKTKLSKVRAGIGIYGVLIGSATLAIPSSLVLDAKKILQSSLTKLRVTGALGIYAYGEGSVDLWIITARFKISAQACVTVDLIYVPEVGGLITWDATLSASYSARVTVGRGFLSTQVTKEGTIRFRIEGHAHF